MKPSTANTLLILVFCLLYGGPSHAYLDPGTGSLMLQIILGGIAGLLVAGKLMWARILDILGLGPGKSAESESETEGED